MTDVTVLFRDSASAVHASEIDYAASMHYSAAYLPSGSSPSLEQAWPDTTSTSAQNTVHIQRFSSDNTRRVFSA